MKVKQKLIRAIHFPFTFKPLDSLLATLLSGHSDNNFFRKIIPANEEFKKKSIRHCTRNGINYVLDISDYQAWLIFFSFKTDSAEGILNLLNGGDTFIDIGGNIGQTALAAAKKVSDKGRVISFEPYPDTYNNFQGNLKANKQIQNIEVIKSGLGEVPGTFKMYQDCVTNSGANRITANQANELAGDQLIQVTTLDIFLQENPLKKIDIIKIDVEGFEMKVLKGASGTLKKFRPAIYMEVDESNLNKQGNTVQEIYDYLKSHDYSITDTETGKEIYNYESLKNRHTDIYCQSYNRIDGNNAERKTQV